MVATNPSTIWRNHGGLIFAEFTGDPQRPLNPSGINAIKVTTIQVGSGDRMVLAPRQSRGLFFVNENKVKLRYAIATKAFQTLARRRLSLPELNTARQVVDFQASEVAWLILLQFSRNHFALGIAGTPDWHSTVEASAVSPEKAPKYRLLPGSKPLSPEDQALADCCFADKDPPSEPTTPLQHRMQDLFH